MVGVYAACEVSVRNSSASRRISGIAIAGPPGPSLEVMCELGDLDAACGKRYEATRSKTMNACFCRVAYSMRCEREKDPGTPSSAAKERTIVLRTFRQ